MPSLRLPPAPAPPTLLAPASGPARPSRGQPLAPAWGVVCRACRRLGLWTGWARRRVRGKVAQRARRYQTKNAAQRPQCKEAIPGNTFNLRDRRSPPAQVQRCCCCHSCWQALGLTVSLLAGIHTGQADALDILVLLHPLPARCPAPAAAGGPLSSPLCVAGLGCPLKSPGNLPPLSPLLVQADLWPLRRPLLHPVPQLYMQRLPHAAQGAGAG